MMVRFLLIGVFAVLAAVAGARELDTFTARAAAAQESPPVATAASAVAPTVATGSGEASIAKSPDGHFWADGEVDGHPIRFLVDTGATAVALTADDARSLGIEPDGLDYRYTVTTANGPAHAAEIRLGLVAVGRAQVSDVQGFVIDHGLQTSLLGMTYLGRLAKFEATPDALVLKS